MSAEGTFIRAFVESWERATSSELTGMDAIAVDGFPGFARALNATLPAEEVGGLYPELGRTGVGTWYYEAVQVQPSNGGFTAVVCEMTSLVAYRPDGGDVYKSGGTDSLGQGWRLTFGPDPRLASDQQQLPATGQRGPASRPPGDVFGSWVASEFKALGRQPAECVRLAPGTPSDWPSPYLRRDPPPTLPPDPGWPAGSPA